MSACNEPWSIPSAWEWSTLGIAATVVGGSTPSTKDASNFNNGEIPWITPADLSGYTEKFIERGKRNITQKGLNESGARMMPSGTVLFSSRAPIGYVAIAKNAVTTNQGFKSFIPSGDLHSDYLYYYLKRAKDIAVGLASGTTFPEISGKKAGEIPVPVPPLDEQKQIVAEIETQFARLDDAVAALKRAQVRLKRYRASVLKAACEGRLVPTEAELARQEGRDYEPASVLLERIKAERAATPGKKRGKAKDIAPPDVSSLPELPEGWVWSTISELSSHITSGSRDWTKYYDRGSGTFLMAQNVRPGHLDLSYRQAVDPPLDSPDRLRSEVRKDDILVTIVGANTGNVCHVPFELSEHYVCQSVALIRPTISMLSRFLTTYLCSDENGQKQFSSYMYGQGRPHLSFEQLRSTALAIPPMAEQERIVAEVDRLLSVADQQEAIIETNLKRADSLRQSILRLAFSGQLIKKDENLYGPQ